ncbi:DUF6378 domain-containing protein [Ochrobactrum sp. A-1]|uniref:DUF6378 domain-containing protein n=1 Tax=Ochrobactrum sp. A-1 TaxID=2920940 RepID=UPI001F0B70A5|nr:DUF6378 domain-containing protein [Ochrobactrum sp. A-1]
MTSAENLINASLSQGLEPLLKSKAVPDRVSILQEGAKLTFGARDAEYGPPEVNMACSGALKKALRDHMTRKMTPAELEAIDMALTKIGRLATGTPKRDTYVDAATYLAIAGEIGLNAKSE